MSTTKLYVRDVAGEYRAASPKEIKAEALKALAGRKNHGLMLTAPKAVKEFLQLKLGDLPHEVFAVLFLDSQNRLIEYREMFRGTLNQTAVYPREVVKDALTLGAAGVIFTHNHPSGIAEPSQADRLLTEHLSKALMLVDVKTLDHIIVAGVETVSFAERGLI